MYIGKPIGGKENKFQQGLIIGSNCFVWGQRYDLDGWYLVDQSTGEFEDVLPKNFTKYRGPIATSYSLHEPDVNQQLIPEKLYQLEMDDGYIVNAELINMAVIGNGRGEYQSALKIGSNHFSFFDVNHKRGWYMMTRAAERAEEKPRIFFSNSRPNRKCQLLKNKYS